MHLLAARTGHQDALRACRQMHAIMCVHEGRDGAEIIKDMDTERRREKGAGGLEREREREREREIFIYDQLIYPDESCIGYIPPAHARTGQR